MDGEIDGRLVNGRKRRTTSLSDTPETTAHRISQARKHLGIDASVNMPGAASLHRTLRV